MKEKKENKTSSKNVIVAVVVIIFLFIAFACGTTTGDTETIIKEVEKECEDDVKIVEKEVRAVEDIDKACRFSSSYINLFDIVKDIWAVTYTGERMHEDWYDMEKESLVYLDLNCTY